MKDNECKNCVAPKRHPGCHDTCESYIAWKAERDATLEKIRESKNLQRIYDDHKKDVVIAIRNKRSPASIRRRKG